MVSARGPLGLHSSLQLLQPSVMPASEKPKKLKIKLSKLSAESEIVSAEVSVRSSGNKCFDGAAGVFNSSVDFNARLSINSRTGHTTISEKEKTTNRSMLQKCRGTLLADRETIGSERGEVCQMSLTNPNKRAAMTILDNQKAKRLKLDSGVLVQCTALLKKLMTHKHGWVFNVPVDPIRLHIPDYFSVISEPMDLGTIKSKLGKKLYSRAEEFATDVRLTFDNAMLYNPPTNDVHHMAKELKSLFESRWKVLESKWSAAACSEYENPSSVGRPSKSLYLRRDVPKAEASCPKTSNKMAVSSLQRQKLRKDLEEISKTKVPPPLLDQIWKMGLIGQHDNRINVDIDAVDEITVCKLQKLIRNFHVLRSVEPTHTEYSSARVSLQQDLHKGNGNISTNISGCVSTKSQTSSACINDSCESINCRCSHHNDFPSDVESERSSGRNINNACHRGSHDLELLANDTASRQTIKSDPDSDGGISAVDEENLGTSSEFATASTGAAASDEGWEIPTYDVQLSPSKALRAARLRSRFADTIVKAREKTLLESGEKSDPVKMKQEKERLERQQREEKARIEAQIKAAEAASRMREEMELKKKREREREAARIALQQVERSVEIYENMEILKEFEMLGGCSEPDYFLAHNRNPLERLGLFMKNEYLEEEEDFLENSSGVVVEEENCSEEVENYPKDIKESEKGSSDVVEGENYDGDVEEGEIAS